MMLVDSLPKHPLKHMPHEHTSMRFQGQHKSVTSGERPLFNKEGIWSGVWLWFCCSFTLSLPVPWTSMCSPGDRDLVLPRQECRKIG